MLTLISLLAYISHYGIVDIPSSIIDAVKLTSHVLILFFLVASIIIYRFRRKPIIPFICIAMLIIPSSVFFVFSKQKLQVSNSEKPIAEYVIKHDPQRRVYLYRDYEKFSSVLFYLGKRVRIIDSLSHDLYYGQRTKAAKGWFVSGKQFVSYAKKQPVYVVLNERKLKGFSKVIAPFKYRILMKNDDVFLLEIKK